MDESGIDMGFDLAALTNAEDFDLEYNNDFEQALSLLSTSQDFMYYELKSRAPDTGRYVNARARWHHHTMSTYAPLYLCHLLNAGPYFSLSLYRRLTNNFACFIFFYFFYLTFDLSPTIFVKFSFCF